jgi:hypothetical protein
MDLATYEYLIGKSVSVEEESYILSAINRTRTILESLLGYTLKPEKVNQNLYNEQGKTPIECVCPDLVSELLPADPVINAYRLYSYNPKAKYLFTDPFYAVHKVKLVKDGITIKTFDKQEITPIYKNGWGKYIELCKVNCQCNADCVQVAVDADWLFFCDSSLGDISIGNCIDEGLLYIWADMVTHYSDCQRDIKSESMLSHSYTKFDNKPPEEANIAYLRKLAGPNGTLSGVSVC